MFMMINRQHNYGTDRYNLGILAAFCRLLLRKRLSKSTAVDRCDTSDNNHYIFPYLQKDQSIASNTNVDS